MPALCSQVTPRIPVPTLRAHRRRRARRHALVAQPPCGDRHRPDPHGRHRRQTLGEAQRSRRGDRAGRVHREIPRRHRDRPGQGPRRPRESRPRPRTGRRPRQRQGQRAARRHRRQPALLGQGTLRHPRRGLRALTAGPHHRTRIGVRHLAAGAHRRRERLGVRRGYLRRHRDPPRRHRRSGQPAAPCAVPRLVPQLGRRPQHHLRATAARSPGRHRGALPGLQPQPQRQPSAARPALRRRA